MELGCLKILHYINRNSKQVKYLCTGNNTHEMKLETNDKKSILINKRGKVVCADPARCQDERFCLNCNLCHGKACAISQIDQSKWDRLFISYLYSKMELFRDINRERAYREFQKSQGR